jgi:hypothetical protein
LVALTKKKTIEDALFEDDLIRKTRPQDCKKSQRKYAVKKTVFGRSKIDAGYRVFEKSTFHSNIKGYRTGGVIHG